MLTKRLVVVFVMFGAFAVVSTTAQSSFGEEKNFFERLDDFGKSIFDGILPTKKGKPKAEKKATPDRNNSANWRDFSDPSDQTGTARAGSVLTREGRQSSNTGRSGMIRPQREPEYMPPVVQRDDIGEPRRVRRPLAGTSLIEDEPEPVYSLKDYPKRNQAIDRPEPRGELTDVPKLVEPVMKPLYKRLEDFRQSAFGTGKNKQQIPYPELAPERSVKPAPIADVAPIAPRSTGRPLIAQRTISRSRFEEGLREPAEPLEPYADQVDDPGVVQVDNLPQKTDNVPQKADNLSQNNSGVLIARKGPNLGVETLGPRTISVDRESTYEVFIINSGDVAAEGLTVFVALPEWADVNGVETGDGDAKAEKNERQVKIVRWNIGRLDAKDRAGLSLKIIPRQPRPFNLEIGWDYNPVGSQAAIEVQEPKLALKLVGPDEVFFGKKELFQLKLSNTGTGNAENVMLSLMPIGTGENVQASHKVGTLKAGETKTLEVELTARQSGNLTIQVEARGEGNLKAELAEKVLVRRGDLKVGLTGPKMQFVGTSADYTVTVSNQGNAPAHNVFLSLTLPAGAEYVSGIEGAQATEKGKRLVWRLESLPVGEELTFAVKCQMTKSGVGQVKLEAIADDDLHASAETTANVEAVADLTMNVKDPTGPIPIGKEVIYEVRVRNRGTETARGVEVFAYFSRGIEPIKAEGAESRLAPGQVIFQPIESLEPNEEIILKVRARADAAGNHVFRAETHCKPLGARLISEATNRYYGDITAKQQMATRPSSEDAIR